MKTVIIIIKFLFLGALFIISNQGLALYDAHNMEQFLTLYYDWLNQVFSNTLQLTSYVVKFEWLPLEANGTVISTVDINVLQP